METGADDQTDVNVMMKQDVTEGKKDGKKGQSKDLGKDASPKKTIST